MATMDTPMCAVCQIPSKQYCSACKLVNYCGPDHQQLHWKQHKTECRPFHFARDHELGRYLFATREIKAGSVLFSEAPLVVGSKWYPTEREKQMAVMPCVGCFTPCLMGANQCKKCHWPSCSSTCAGLENPNLHGLECSILMLGPGPVSNTDTGALIDYYRSDALIVLKCLCLQRLKPKKWNELMNMQSHAEERVGSVLQREVEQRIVSYLQKNFLQRLKTVEQKTKEKFLSEYNKDVLHRICGIIETNYMCINLPTGIELSGVYYTACMMEHACKPNCYFEFDHHNGFKISVVAGCDIQKAEHLKISYSNILWGTQMRQEHLSMTKHFLCKCERCCDPTEYGTHFSTLLCMGDVGTECSGLQVPKEPLNMSTDWVCDRCPVIIGGQEVRFLLSQITTEVDDLLSRKPTIKQLEALIEKLSKFLHPNHYHMFSLKHSLIQLYGNEAGSISDKLNDAQMDKKMQICNELLAICQKLDPDTIRLSIYVCIIFYEMHSLLVERGNRLLLKADKTVANKRQAVEVYQQACEHLIQARKVLARELDTIAGKKLNATMSKALLDLEVLIEGSTSNT